MKFPQLKFWLILIISVCAACETKNVSNTTAGNLNEKVVVQMTPTATVSPRREPDVPYVPTPEVVVDEMLRMADVKGGDVLFDLGSGDGRIPITAAKRFGTRGVGIDINPVRIREANANAKKQGVTDKVKFIEGDIFEADFSEATVVTLYLLPDINLKLKPRLLEQLKPGTRVVSHNYDMGDWNPDEMKVVKTVDDTDHYVYLWRIPERK